MNLDDPTLPRTILQHEAIIRASMRDVPEPFSTIRRYECAGTLLVTSVLTSEVKWANSLLFDFFSHPSKMTVERMRRITQIADALYELRDQPCIDDLVRRARTRDLGPTYFELLAARIFHRLGIEVQCRPEQGAKGEDFDFLLRLDDCEAAAEVTGLTAKDCKIGSVVNRLKKKRKQLPQGLPSVIVVFVPPTWRAPDLESKLKSIARDFLKSTNGVNHLLLYEEQHRLLDPPFGRTELSLVHAENYAARHPAAWLRHALNPPIVMNVGDPLVYQNNIHGRRPGDFYDWVDGLLGTPFT